MRILDRWELGSPVDASGQEIWHGHFIIISERVKQALEDASVTGVRFTEV